MRTDQVHYTLQFDIADGKMAEFEELTQQAIDGSFGEPGTLVYRWQMDESGSSVQLHERFADEAAMGAHLTGHVATEIFPKLMEISEVSRFDVHGDLSDESTAALKNFGATVFSGWKGFDR